MMAWRERKIAETGKDPILVFRRRRRAYIIELLGGGCQICWYNRCQRNLSFHHLREKRFSLAERAFQFSAKKLVPELRKCVLVCHNCHGEIHEGGIHDPELLVRLNEAVRGALAGPLCFPTSKVSSGA